MAASAAGSRLGDASGIQVFIWNGPLLLDLNSCTHARIACGSLINAPSAPMLPTLASAIDRVAGHAPAIGASNIGNFKPYFAQNASERWRGLNLFDIRSGFPPSNAGAPGNLDVASPGQSQLCAFEAGAEYRQEVTGLFVVLKNEG